MADEKAQATAAALPEATLVLLRDMAAALIKRGVLFRSDFQASISELVASGQGTPEWYQAELIHTIINDAIKIADGEVIPLRPAKRGD